MKIYRLFFVFAAIMLLGLSACGGGSSNSSDTTTNNDNEGTEDSNSASEEVGYIYTYKLDGLGDGVCVEQAFENSSLADVVVNSLGFSFGTCLGALGNGTFAYCEIQFGSEFDWIQQHYYFETSISVSDAQFSCSGWGGVYVELGNIQTADAGVDQLVVVGSLVDLGGYNPGSDGRSFFWNFVSVPDGSVAILDDAFAETPTFIADVLGDYEVALVITDGGIEGARDTVVVTAATELKGIISTDTVLEEDSSPFIITDDVQIAYGVTLTISAGVKVLGDASGAAFEAFGDLNVVGTEQNRVIFEDLVFLPKGINNVELGRVSIDYADISNSKITVSEQGCVTLRNSILSDMPVVGLFFPRADCVFERNVFINTDGIEASLSIGVMVTIRNNVFYNSEVGDGDEFFINNRSATDSSGVIAEYNSFMNADRIAMRVGTADGVSQPNLIGVNNYWGTDDADVIDAMIFDNNDDLNVSAQISYSPFLIAPHVDTPDASAYIP